MAKYRDQQNIAVESAEVYNRILGELMSSPFSEPGARFIAPVEILLCLGCSGWVSVPSNNRPAWHVFGNATHEFHALTGLLTAWNFKQHACKRPPDS